MTGSISYTPNSLASDIFAANTSCILAPEVTDGPYYVTGEMIRKNVKETQTGIDHYLELQYVDVWNCNSPGSYSGVESGQAGLNTTFLRGVQKTDEDGVVAFETLFPGALRKPRYTYASPDQDQRDRALKRHYGR
jgi:hypothetical protein